MDPKLIASLLWLLLCFDLISCKQDQNKKALYPTFSEHIAPIIYKSCTPCYHSGAAAPFSLIVYSDVKKHAKTIALTVESKVMPPWPADPSYSHFRDEKYLTEDEIELIKEWVNDGAPQGDSTKTPAVPVFQERSK